MMVRKIIYIALVLIAFNLFCGFNLNRLPKWFQAQWDYYGGKYLSASEQYNAASAGEKDYVMQFNEGAADYRDGDFEKAEELFTKSAETNPEYTDAFYNQGNARFRQNNLEGAVESYENALKIDPEHEDARYNLEYVKKLLEQKTNSPDNADPSSDQRSQNAQSSEREPQEERDNKPEDKQKGENDENSQPQGDEEAGEGQGGTPQEKQDEQIGEGGGGSEDTEEQPPEDVQNKSNMSGMTDQQIENLLDSLAEEERQLAGQMMRRPDESVESMMNELGMFEDLFSLQRDLDPFATRKQKSRPKDEIDW